MKILKILGIIVLSISGISHSYSVATETLSLEQKQTIPQIISHLQLDLNEFRENNPQLNYGVSSIENLYNSGMNIEELYGQKKYHSCLRKILLKLELLTGGVCGGLRCLSVFHPDIDALAKALIGCCVGKAFFLGS